MPKCKVCGTRLAEGVAKCPNCGAAAGSTVSGTVSPGANLQKSACPACNKQILGEHKYCPNCGTDLNSASARATNNIQQNPAIQQMTQTRTQANGQELVSDNSHKTKNETEKQQLQSNAQAKQQKSVQKQLSGKYIALVFVQWVGCISFIVHLFTMFGLPEATIGLMITMIIVMVLLMGGATFIVVKPIVNLDKGKKSPNFVVHESLISAVAVIGLIMNFT